MLTLSILWFGIEFARVKLLTRAHSLWGRSASEEGSFSRRNQLLSSHGIWTTGDTRMKTIFSEGFKGMILVGLMFVWMRMRGERVGGVGCSSFLRLPKSNHVNNSIVKIVSLYFPQIPWSISLFFFFFFWLNSAFSPPKTSDTCSYEPWWLGNLSATSKLSNDLRPWYSNSLLYQKCLYTITGRLADKFQISKYKIIQTRIIRGSWCYSLRRSAKEW
jgi:hypothetical protein